MVPAGTAVDGTIEELRLLLARRYADRRRHSRYRDSQRRAQSLAERFSDFVDCGTSGGIWGLSEGYSLMLGGSAAAVERYLQPLLETLAPAADRGWGRVGPAGAGHFTKVIPQRHRIRPDAGVCRGLLAAAAQAGVCARPISRSILWKYKVGNSSTMMLTNVLALSCIHPRYKAVGESRHSVHR